MAGSVVAKDAAHDLRLMGKDLQVAAHRLALGVLALDDAVSVRGGAAGGLAFLDPSAQADMQFGDLALGEGDDGNAGEGEMLEEVATSA